METYPLASLQHYKQQQQIAAATVSSALKVWRRMGSDFDSSWADVLPPMLNVVQTGRLAAATTAVGYTPAVLAETGQDAPAVGAIVPQSFVDYAPDGRPVDSLMGLAVIKAKESVGRGVGYQAALDLSGSWLTGTLLTVMADTSRGVTAADLGSRPAITGYVRMLNSPSCSRCVILAGKWFRWNQGFQRHKNCDCRHIPASEDLGGDMRTDPYSYFHSLSETDQEKLFGRIEARAIRDGGDIYRIVNLQSRGLGTVKSYAKYGTPHKMTIDEIYRTAGNRKNAILMMQREGYITGAQARGGNILGNGIGKEGFGQLGKGGNARAASNAILDSRASGVRDPLNVYTMTAAERRVYSAYDNLRIARSGIDPSSVGTSTADKFLSPRAITSQQRGMYESAWADVVGSSAAFVPSVRTVFDLLAPRLY